MVFCGFSNVLSTNVVVIIRSILCYGLLILLSAVILKINSVFAAPPYGAFAPESTIDPRLMQIDESKHLGSRLEKDYTFVDVDGRAFALDEMIGKPLILLLSYYGCDGTCPILNTNLKKVLSKIDRFKIGEDYKVLTVSFDKHDSQETLRHFIKKSEIPMNMRKGWRHAILKNKETDIDRLTTSVGYNYFWSRADQVFLHPNVLILFTPEGRVARYLYGTAIDKDTLELALIDADWNRIANSTDVINMLTGVCYSYNFEEGKYTFNYSLFIGLGSLFFGVSLLVFSIVIFRLKRNN
jgi:protein SCO1/2